MNCEKIKDILSAYELGVKMNQHLIKKERLKLKTALVEWLIPVTSIDEQKLINLVDKDLKCREKNVDIGYKKFAQKLKSLLDNTCITDISDAILRCSCKSK